MLIPYTNVFERNLAANKTVVLNQGGARSSKSYSICQMLVYRFINYKNYKLLVTRKTLPALRLTAYKLFVEILSEWGYYNKVKHNKTLRTIELGGKEVVFTSFDDPNKIKSTDFNDIWMEEANEFSYEDFITLKTRLSARRDPGTINQIFLSYNPVNEFSFINKKLVFEKDTLLIKSTYKDNPFLSKEYVQLLESLMEQDENFYKIYALGEYGNIEGVIYNHFLTKEIFPESYNEIIYGLDFGYNVPSALIKIGINDNEYYLREMFYKTKMKNSDIIGQLESLGVNKSDYIYCDNAEPDKIQEICDAGYNAHPGDKSVKNGIDFVKRCTIYTHPENVNLNQEYLTYSWKKDKNGNALDEPIKFNDHALDAVRYGIYTHNKDGVPSIRVI